MKRIVYAPALFWLGLHLCASGAPQGLAGMPGNLTWRFQYDDAGRIVKSMDPAGRATRVEYGLDDGGNAGDVSRHLPDGSVTRYEYDDLGRRVGMTDAHGHVAYRYDGLGRLTHVQRHNTPSVALTYDTMDRVTSLSAGADFRTGYKYDFAGRLSAIQTPVGNITYDYQRARGRVIRTLPNGVRTTMEFFPNGRLQSISHVAPDDRVLSQFTYARRPDGLISSIKEYTPQGQKVVQYEYDGLCRLTRAADSTGQDYAFGYDKLGNRLTLEHNGQNRQALAYDWAGRLTKYNGKACAYDAVGNLVACTEADGQHTFSFDTENRLKSASGTGKGLTYQYDGDGYLLARVAENGRTSFVPDITSDIWRPLLAEGADGSRTFYVWDKDTPLLAIVGKKVKCFLHDHLGSVRCVADEKGSITQRFEYRPFGEPMLEAEGNGLCPRFAGLFFDSVSSLYLPRARAYAPELGRFLQRDPLQHALPGAQTQFSPYHYCGDDPVNLVDVNGAFPMPPYMPWDPNPSAIELERIAHLSRMSERVRREAEANDRAHHSHQSMIAEAYRYAVRMNDLAHRWRQRMVADAGRQAVKFSQRTLDETFNTLGRTLGMNWFGRNVTGGNRSAYQRDSVGEFPLGDTTVPARNLLDHFARLHDIEYYISTHNPKGTAVTLTGPRGTPETYISSGSPAAANWKLAWRVLGAFNRRSPMALFGPPPAESTRSGHASNASLSRSAADPIRDTRRHEIGLPPWPPSGGLVPSNVGGIYMRGAGEALAGLGQLKGVALDSENGELVLLAEEQGRVDLPPLRLDDVVTVFRSVYEHGQAPFVSIDPNPEDPEGPIMLIRHGEATADTYVGWTLFEADRVMKCYSLGYDNVTRKPVQSGIAGYKNLFDLGFSSVQAGRQEPIWERFWIVPSEVTQHRAGSALTLFDVPLKVKTQRMQLQGGKLVPAADDTPSKQARVFSKWFTEQYDAIAAEATSRPPEGSGIPSPKPSFTELRRIALATAIAERLRNQGVPFPGWMRDYPVKPCPMPGTTPAITVTATKTETKHVVRGSQAGLVKSTQEQRIFGGVNLAPDDADVRIVSADRKTDGLLADVVKAVRDAPGPGAVAVEKGGETYRVLSLPGNGTRALGPCRLEETDLVVPTQRGRQVALVRKCNSFFSPDEGLGEGWTLDLPHLARQQLPVQRTGDAVEYRTVYELTSPFVSCSESFREIRRVPELDAEVRVPLRSRSILGLVNVDDEKIGIPTKVVVFRDGSKWHFDDDGFFVAETRTPTTVIYRRDGAHRVRRVEGWYGAHLRGDIRMEYGTDGQLAEAKGSNGETVTYRHDAGRLVAVKGDTATTYAYDEGLVTSVAGEGRPVRRFGYGDQGRLLWEERGGDSRVTYTVSRGGRGSRIEASTKSGRTSAAYDASLRPTERVLADGTRVAWTHGDAGASEAVVTSADGTQHRVARSEDGRQLEWTLAGDAVCSVEYDAAERPVVLRRGGSEILRNTWHPNGLLKATVTEGCAVHPEYREDGVRSGVLITPSNEAGPRFSKWMEQEYDEQGRTAKLTDYAGQDVRFGYDGTRQDPSVVAWTWQDQQVTVRRERDAEGRVKSVKTNWGYAENNTYDSATSQLTETVIENGGQKATVSYADGRPAAITQFDGATTRMRYYGMGPNKGKLQQISRPEGVTVSRSYDDSHRLASVDCAGTYRSEYAYDSAGRLTSIAMTPLGE